jgi:hypothetical protein
MRRFLRLAATSSIAVLTSTAPVMAAEMAPGDSSSGFELAAGTLTPDSLKNVAADLGSARSKAAFTNATPAVRVAPCGVEADAGNANLDAGLIDFNIPDPARAAGHSYDDPRDVGRDVRDYHSSVILGVTLGYHF